MSKKFQVILFSRQGASKKSQGTPRYPWLVIDPKEGCWLGNHAYSEWHTETWAENVGIHEFASTLPLLNQRHNEPQYYRIARSRSVHRQAVRHCSANTHFEFLFICLFSFSRCMPILRSRGYEAKQNLDRYFPQASFSKGALKEYVWFISGCSFAIICQVTVG